MQKGDVKRDAGVWLRRAHFISSRSSKIKSSILLQKVKEHRSITDFTSYFATLLFRTSPFYNNAPLNDSLFFLLISNNHTACQSRCCKYKDHIE